MHQLSMLDPYPYDDYLSTLRTPETRELLHTMERETIVLLENKQNTLPLSKSINSVALIGPQVDRVSVRLPQPPSCLVQCLRA